MRLALLTYDFPPSIGGVQTYLVEIARRLGEDYDLWVLTSQAETQLHQAEFRVSPVRSRHALAYLNALRSVRPEYIWVGHTHPQLLLASFLYAPKGYCAVAHGNDYVAAQKQWHRPLFNHLLRRSNPLITTTQANALRLQKLGIPVAHTVPPGTDPSRFYPPAKILPYPPVLLTVGRLVPRKGHDIVLQALPELIHIYPGIRYHIVGEGPTRPLLQSLAEDLRITSAVNFWGSVTEAQLPELYRQAHLFVMPAREDVAAGSIEGFGIVYLEASASGLPVVATNTGGVAEAIRDGTTGHLVPVDDPHAFIQAVHHLLGDDAARETMGQAGRAWIVSEMNWDRAAAQMKSILEQADVSRA